MAQFGFGLNTIKTAQENGYDNYKTSLFESLGAVAEDNWNFNPVMSLFNIFGSDTFNIDGIVPAAKESRAAGLIPRDKNLLNEEYRDLGLYFERNEYQSVVDIMVDRKKKRKRKTKYYGKRSKRFLESFIWWILCWCCKTCSRYWYKFSDPINIGASFIPIYGQARFARSIAKAKGMNVKSAKAFRNTRLKRGVIEGAGGALIIEPLVYGVAQRIQADYDIYDSFLNVAFGSVIGGGLHVGAGKLKDMNTNANFQSRIRINRENLSKGDNGKQEVDLYAEYYPKETVNKMMELDQMNPETRDLLLQKSIGDLMLDEPVNTGPIANADPTLNGTSTAQLDLQLIGAKKNLAIIKRDTQIIIKDGGKVNKIHLQKAIKKYNDLLAKRKKLIKTTKTEPVITDPVVNRKKVSKEMPSESPQKIITNEDVQLKTAEERLVKLRTKQNDAGLPLEFTNKSTGQKDATLKEADEELQEINSKSDDIEAGVADYINCRNGNN